MNRNTDIDFLKGIAIIAVILFHFGVLPHGYLGVDIFLVVNGYFITKGIMVGFDNGTFSYPSFMAKRLVRLWPAVLILGLASLLLGFFVMLPDDYENVAQGVVASNLFANNILACITIPNYWDIANPFKPQMHLWYLGILMQMYVIYPLFLLVFKKISPEKGIGIGVVVLTFLSLMAFVLPYATNPDKFYYLPYRFYEMGLGGLVAIYSSQLVGKTGFISRGGAFLLIIALLLTGEMAISNTIKVLAACILAVCVLLATLSSDNASLKPNLIVAQSLCAVSHLSAYIFGINTFTLSTFMQ